MLMMKCTEATYLMSKESDQPLTKKERFSLFLHNIYCIHCRRFRKSMMILKKVLSVHSVKNIFSDIDLTEKLNDSTKDRIKKILNKQ